MTAATPAQAQASLDVFCSGTADARSRKVGGIASSVGALADAEPLLALPAAPYPATVIVSRVAGANAAVAFRGNSYWVPPGLGGTEVQRRRRLGTATLEICSPAGAPLAFHRRARRCGHPGRPPATAPSWNGWCCRHSPPTGRASARATTRPAGQPAPRPPGCSPAWALR